MKKYEGINALHALDSFNKTYQGWGFSKGNAKVSKLNPDKVREIRKLHSQGEKSISIAAKFAVSVPCITSILSGRTWGYVK